MADERIKELQKVIHSGREHPFESGRLARLVGVPITHCPWIKGSWQHRAFVAGYQRKGVKADG